jgi:integrase
MATVVKNSSGNWKALIRKKGWPTTSKTFNTKRDATDWSRRIEDEMVRGVYINRASSERLTIEAALTRYLKEISPSKAKSTATREKSLSKPIIEALGGYSMAALTSEVLATYRDNRLNSNNHYGSPISANQVRLELALISHMYTVAIQEWGIGIPYNPIQTIRKPNIPSGRDRRLSLNEEKVLLDTCKKLSNPMLYWMTILALETAMRRNEIVSLRRSQVDLKKRIIVLRSSETKNREARTVPLSQRAVEILDKAMNKHIRIIDSDLIFWGNAKDKEGQRKPYAFNKVWSRVLQKTSLHDFKFHDLRHEAISRMVEGGLSDQEVAAISGHKTMQMLKRYTHLRSEHLINRLDSMNEGVSY